MKKPLFQNFPLRDFTISNPKIMSKALSPGVFKPFTTTFTTMSRKPSRSIFRQGFTKFFHFTSQTLTRKSFQSGFTTCKSNESKRLIIMVQIILKCSQSLILKVI